MPRRTGQTVWVICLTELNKNEFALISDLLCALIGRVCLLTDLSIFETLNVCEESGVCGVFDSVVSRTQAERIDINYWRKLSGNLHIYRYDRTICIDTCPSAVVAAKLLGWVGCLIAPDNIVVEKTKHRTSDKYLGRGPWYDARFADMHSALSHFIFGSIAPSINLHTK